MQPGPILIFACPHCRELARDSSWLSGNTIGAEYWSDGKVDAPMMPDEPGITRCYRCSNYYWKHDAEIICEIGDEQNTPEQDLAWKASKPMFDLSARDYVSALLGAAQWEPHQQIHLRKLLWWEQNNLERWCERDRIANLPPDILDWAIQNPKATETDEDRNARRAARLIEVKAEYPGMKENEIYERQSKAQSAIELKDFDEARRLLDVDCPPKESPVFSENLLQLSELLDEKIPDQRIMLAEMARELGDFDKALSLLSFRFEESFEDAVAVIRDAALDGVRSVLLTYRDDYIENIRRKSKKESRSQPHINPAGNGHGAKDAVTRSREEIEKAEITQATIIASRPLLDKLEEVRNKTLPKGDDRLGVSIEDVLCPALFSCDPSAETLTRLLQAVGLGEEAAKVAAGAIHAQYDYHVVRIAEKRADSKQQARTAGGREHSGHVTKLQRGIVCVFKRASKK